jgi:transcriptional regulator with XRE-family HTH domain
MRFHFQLLPVRPKPVFPESQTGYILRLAYENSVDSISAIQELLFPTSHRRVIFSLDDFPPKNINIFAESLDCTMEDIRSTTFFYLVEFFGRTTVPQIVSKFLHESISQVFRYCPRCIQQYKRYSLLWRFKDIICCHIHGSYLIDKCLNCNKSIPIFPSNLSFCECPYCGESFGKAQYTYVMPEVLLKQQSIALDLEYLLKPKPLIQNNDIPLIIGKILKEKRTNMGLTTEDLRNKILLSSSRLSAIENGNFKRAKVSFRDYAMYMELLNLKFRQLNPTQSPFDAISQKKSRKDELSAEETISRIKETLGKMPVGSSIDEICRVAGVSYRRAFLNSKYYELFPKAKLSTLVRMQERERETVSLFKKAIAELKHSANNISKSQICEQLGISRNSILDLAEIDEIISQAQQENFKYMEDMYVNQIQTLIGDKTSGKKYSVSDIERHLGVSRDVLRKYPAVANIINEVLTTWMI